MRAERSRHVVLVTPPAVERAGAVWDLVGAEDGLVVIVCSDYGVAVGWAEVAPRPVHPLTGLTRTATLLKEGRVGVVAGSVPDLSALVARSALTLDSVRTVVLAWPEGFAAAGGEHAAPLDALLAELPEARRIVLSWNPAALQDLIERHARRAEVIGTPPPPAPVAAARYAVRATVPETVDALNALRPLIWRGGPIAPPPDGCDAVIAAILPSGEELAALARLGEPLVLVTAAQLPYLRSIAAPLAPLRLPAAPDRAHDRAEALRGRIAALIETGVDAELALLDPLFERFDPAEVAAALLAISRQSSVVSPSTAIPTWIKVFVNVGKKDRAGAKDLVGALTREVGLEKSQIGHIEVRDTFTLIEIATDVVERAIRGLGATAIKGRRLVARLERA